MKIWSKLYGVMTGRHRVRIILIISVILALLATELTFVNGADILMVILVLFASITVVPCVLFVLTSETVVESISRKHMKRPEEQAEEQEPEQIAPVAETAETQEKTVEYDYYNPLTVIWREMQDVSAPRYQNVTALSALCKNFETFAADAGLLILPAEVQKLFSAMSSSRLILLESETNQKRRMEGLVGVLAAFFGAEMIEGPVSSGKTAFSDVLYRPVEGEDDNTVVPTEFFKEIYRSKCAADTVRPVLFRDVDLGSWQATFEPLIPFFQSPSLAPNVTVASSDENGIPGIENGTMKMPINLWFFIVCEKGTARMANEWRDLAVTLNLRAEGNLPSGVSQNVNAVSYGCLTQLFRSEENTAFSGEGVLEYWKRYDRIMESVAEQHRYQQGNRAEHIFEQFFAVAVGCGADPVAAFDRIFATLLVPQLVLNARDAETFEEKCKVWLAVADEVFGNERLPETQSAVRGALQDLRDRSVTAGGEGA